MRISRLAGIAVVLAVACAVACGKGSKKRSRDKDEAASESTPISVAVERCEELPVGSTTGSGGMAMKVVGDQCERTQGRPVIRVGQTVVGNGLDKTAVRRAVRRKMKDVRACYEKQLEKEPKLEGKLVVDITLDLVGKVVEIRSKGLHPRVAECVQRILEEAQFPKSHTGGILKVRLPFLFQSCAHAKSPPETPDAAVPVGVTDVVAQLQANLAQFQRCFEQARERGDEVPGRLRLDIAVQSNGKVADARSPDMPPTVKPGELHTCVASAARAMTLPASAGGRRQARCTLTSGAARR